MNEVEENDIDNIDNIFNDDVATEEVTTEEPDYTDPSNSPHANQSFLDYEDTENKDLETKVYDQIKTVFDPEIPVNIYELGLIYDVSITKNKEAVVLMTLTTPNCPVAGGLPKEVEDRIKEHPEVKDAKVILTFDPAWDMSMMSEEAKFELGLL